MEIVINGKTYTPKYTYNSFRYMGDLDISDINRLETHPFKIMIVTEQLLFGALNYDPKRFVPLIEVQKYMEEVYVEGKIFELAEELMGMLEQSSFFQNLQGEEIEKKVVQAKKK